MEDTVITMVYPSNVSLVWPLVVSLLDPALAIAGTHEIGDVRKSIMGGQAQLWVQWTKDKGVDAAVVTEFVNYPKGLWFRLWLSGAQKQAKIMWDKFFDILYEFADKNDCVGLEDCGRSGWERHIPQGKKTRNIAMLRRIKIDRN